jgi:hypothetical protein
MVGSNGKGNCRSRSVTGTWITLIFLLFQCSDHLESLVVENVSFWKFLLVTQHIRLSDVIQLKVHSFKSALSVWDMDNLT